MGDALIKIKSICLLFLIFFLDVIIVTHINFIFFFKFEKENGKFSKQKNKNLLNNK
jgi:hypothetical protein